MSINIKIDEFNYDTDSLMIVNQNIILENGIYVLVGENGIGKTTFLNILAGNFKAKLNVILNNSKLDIYNNKNIIFLKEEFLGLEYLKACEVIDYFLIIYGKEKSYHFVEKMMNIARFDENFLNKMIINLSKGTRQKLIFIIYMILDLDVIIFDESLENIEEEAFHSIIDYLIKESTVRFCLIATHHSYIKNQVLNHIRLFKNNSSVNFELIRS